MLVPVELVIFVCGLIIAGLGSMGTAVVHLLIRINATVNQINTTTALQGMRIQSLETERERA